MVKMCHEANIDGYFTNHSLRASGASTVFQSEVPEKIIQEFTDHRLLNALTMWRETLEGSNIGKFDEKPFIRQFLNHQCFPYILSTFNYQLQSHVICKRSW